MFLFKLFLLDRDVSLNISCMTLPVGGSLCPDGADETAAGVSHASHHLRHATVGVRESAGLVRRNEQHSAPAQTSASW